MSIDKRNLSIEELIELAKLPTPKELRKKKKEEKKNKPKLPKISLDRLEEVSKFINFFRLSEGKNRVPSRVIFDTYSKWSTELPLTKSQFFTRFSKFFKAEREPNYTYYLLNRKGWELQMDITEWLLQNEKK